MMSQNDDEYNRDEKILFFEMDYLPEFFRRKCEVELNETPDNKKKHVQDLKSMLEGNELTKHYKFEDDFLVQYLRHSKYDVQKALERLRKYIAQRNKHGHLFTSVPDLHCKDLAKFIYPLPNRTPDGCTMFLARAGNWNPEEMEFNNFVRSFIMVFTQLMRDPMTQINGFKCINDSSGMSWRHYIYCTVFKLHFIFHTTMECMPCRFKEIHFVNESFIMKAAWSLIRRFLSEKLRKRVYFHSKTEDLLDFFPKSVLPVEYGGDLKDVNMEEWLRKANSEHEKNTIEGQPNYY